MALLMCRDMWLSAVSFVLGISLVKDREGVCVYIYILLRLCFYLIPIVLLLTNLHRYPLLCHLDPFFFSCCKKKKKK